MKEKKPDLPLASLACVNPDCDLYGQKGRNNLTIRKVCGQDQIRYLRCRGCQQEFSERKNTALWNSKIAEEKAVSVAEHLADGCGLKSTARLVKVDPSTMRRLNQKVGTHGRQYHEQEVQDVAVSELQADERYGFAGSKQQPAWEAELMDPQSKFILAHVQGARDESLIRCLLQEGAARLRHRQEVALFTERLPMCKSSNTKAVIACKRSKSGIPMAAKSGLNRLWPGWAIMSPIHRLSNAATGQPA